MKKIICFLLLSIFCFCGLGTISGCREIGLRLYESEFFIYTVGYDTNNVSILGLTDKGKEQEYLVIPETIANKEVTSVDYWELATRKITKKYGDAKYSGLQSDSLKKIFITQKIKVYSEKFFTMATNQLSVFFISNDTMWQERMERYDYYVTKDNVYIPRGALINHKANVTYFYNYENAKNDGYYWIDNYAYGEKIEYIPENPTRDGYTFDGWYKESECINKWNFEVDTLPEEQFNEEEITIYQETKLYAKWIEN